MLLNAVRDFFLLNGLKKKYWIAYSGGLDSQVLLSICNALRTELNINLTAIHVNHGLSTHAQKWAEHCKKTCEMLQILQIEARIQINAEPGESLEEQAREKRYKIFAEYMAEDDVLLTAHQQDDQAETVLLQLLRGAGPKGLAAMPVIKPFAQGYHARPLLHFSRADLMQYAQENELVWMDDESNNNISFTRNFLRHEILSRLKTRWPNVTSAISRSASHCAENQTLLEEFAHEYGEQIQGSHPDTLSIEKLKQFNPDKQRLILRTWISRSGKPIPDTRKIAAIQSDVFTAAPDRFPHVQWGDVVLRRYRDDLFLTAPLNDMDTQQEYSWDLRESLQIQGIGCLHSRQLNGQGLSAKITQVKIRFRQGGEMVTIPGRGRHTLKNLLQEWGVLPWERDSLPLIYVADQIIAIAGYFLNSDFAAQPHETGSAISFERIGVK